MHVTGRDLGRFTGRYRTCYIHELLPDIFVHVSSHIPCVVLAYSTLGTGVFHGMRGTGVFHAWYRHIPYMVQAYSMHGTGVCVLCVVQVQCILSYPKWLGPTPFHTM